MMCYRDMTFCNGANGTCKHFGICERALTQGVKDAARKWWGADSAPIAQFSEPHKLECYEPKQQETK